MKIFGLLILILLNCTCFGQISSKISIKCGTENQEAQKFFDVGNDYLSANKLDKAKVMFLSAVKLDSTFCDAWDNLSVCCRKMGRYRDAFVSGLHSIMIDSTNAIAWINCGNAAFLGNNIFNALKSFDNLQRVIPNNPEGYYGKSMVLYSIDSLIDARVNILKAEQIYKTNNLNKVPEVDLLKGLIEYKSGNLKEAQNIFEEIYSRFKDNAELNYFYGMCVIKNENNLKKSQKYIDKAINLGYIIKNESLPNK